MLVFSYVGSLELIHLLLLLSHMGEDDASELYDPPPEYKFSIVEVRFNLSSGGENSEFHS